MITLTDSASDRIRKFMDEEAEPTYLRIFIVGGGCSGFSYGFKLDTTVEDDDTSVEHLGVTAIVDPLSLQYLSGAEIDFVDSIQGSYFKVNNPNATGTCGCGESFTA